MSYNIADINLPAVMASLEMLTVNTSSSSNHGPVFRKNVQATDSNKSLNRRYNNISSIIYHNLIIFCILLDIV